MRSYSRFLARKRAEFGKKFDLSELAIQFIPYYESGQRIKVHVSTGWTITGTVEVTTGWRPCFLLMRTVRSQGSVNLLKASDRIIAIKRGRKYEQISER